MFFVRGIVFYTGSVCDIREVVFGIYWNILFCFREFTFRGERFVF